MDPFRFDAFTRSLSGRGASRRALLRSIAGGVAIAGFAAAPGTEAKKKKCKPGLTRCGKKCADLTTNAKNCGNCKNSCPFAIDCIAATCVLRNVGDSCDIDTQCVTGKCSLLDPQTCRNNPCKETGSCGSEAECCEGICFQGNDCCNGVC